MNVSLGKEVVFDTLCPPDSSVFLYTGVLYYIMRRYVDLFLVQVTQSPIQRQLHRVLEEYSEACRTFRAGQGDNQNFLMASQAQEISMN